MQAAAAPTPGTQKEAIEVDSVVRKDAAALQRTIIRELRSTSARAERRHCGLRKSADAVF